MVGTVNMSTNFPTDAAIVNVKGTDSALALTVDCNSRYIFADPVKGTEIAVAEAARNIVCSGGVPQAITNCLNFGNPYNPEVYWQFVGAIKGMGNACRKFNTPVTGGNVSFYNQSSYEGPVFPTPTIGMLGLLENKEHAQTLSFQQPGDIIYILGTSSNDLGSSQYLYSYHGEKFSSCPEFNLDEEFEFQQNISKLLRKNSIENCHDVSDGGLFISLIESCLENELGFSIETNKNYRIDAFLFGEKQSRAIISVSPEESEMVESTLKKFEQPFERLGEVTDKSIVINGTDYGNILDFKNTFQESLGKLLS
jgi:phosphoribosylformylglycinamidine synthase